MNNPSRVNRQPDVVLNLKGGFRIRFFWIGDRFGHQFESITDPEFGVVADASTEDAAENWIVQSIESDSSVAWPSSPPWQQVVGHDHDAESSSSLLAVGLSGRGHWSAAIDPVKGEPKLRFDVACRTPVAPDQLGCSYRIAPNATMNLAGDFVSVTLGNTTLEFRFSNPGQVVSTAEGTFGIGVIPQARTWPMTFTWNYTIVHRRTP